MTVSLGGCSTNSFIWEIFTEQACAGWSVRAGNKTDMVPAVHFFHLISWGLYSAILFSNPLFRLLTFIAWLCQSLSTLSPVDGPPDFSSYKQCWYKHPCLHRQEFFLAKVFFLVKFLGRRICKYSIWGDKLKLFQKVLAVILHFPSIVLASCAYAKSLHACMHV